MTRLFGVIGHPIGHSLSPVLHTAAFRALRLDALYEPFDVPKHFLSPMLHGLANAGVEGLNVTVPLKEAIVPLLDHLDPAARAIGAVNTIVIHNRRLSGYNTDAAGFRRALTELGWRTRPAHVVILGAGGAARAVGWALAATPGMRLTIANRHVERARRLARWLARMRPQSCVRAVALHEVALEDAQLLVNATTVGMHRDDPSPVASGQLRRSLMVYDLVYQHETALVRSASRRGCVAAGGLSMLLYQGGESLRLWLHRPPPLVAMRRALQQAVRE
jgi:shikimate dehydrogenase